MFHVGQKVRCVKRGRWKINPSRPTLGTPKFGSVNIVSGIYDKNGTKYLFLQNCRRTDIFLAENFRPLTEDPKAVKRTMKKWFDKHLSEGVSA